jgi:hypothetical protein
MTEQAAPERPHETEGWLAQAIGQTVVESPDASSRRIWRLSQVVWRRALADRDAPSRRRVEDLPTR